jgi:ABC-type lipoprotein release transport system permease subunit
MFHGVSTFDPWTFALTAALLAVVVLTATLWPARRAAAVDPMRAMRTD